MKTFLYLLIAVNCIIALSSSCTSETREETTEQYVSIDTPAIDSISYTSTNVHNNVTSNDVGTPNKQSTSPNSVVIYSGNCVMYRRDFQDSQQLLTEESQGFGKIVINESTKKFSFFYNGTLVFSDVNFLSYVDDDQGGEGYSFSGGFSAHRFTAEQMFQIFESGYLYEIIPYSVN